MKLCNYICFFRKINGISQSELAYMCGCSREHLNRIENGSERISLKLAFKIAEFLDVSISDLFILIND